jgi:hypothetical protein
MEKDNIDQAEILYKAGDYRGAREIAKKIESLDQVDDGEKQRAKQILTATGVDPMVSIAFFITAALIVFLIVWYIL